MMFTALDNCNIALRGKNLRVRVEERRGTSYYKIILDNLDNGKEVYMYKDADTNKVEEVLGYMKNFSECLDIIS